jgi:hypothetical protein
VSKAIAVARRCAVHAALLLCVFLSVLVLPVTGAAAGARDAASSGSSPDAGSSGRQILVMLRIPPEHHRPSASYGGDYGDAFTIAQRRRLAQNIARRYGLAFIGDGWQMKLLGLDCYVMQVGPDEPIGSAMKRISADPDILWSEPMQVYEAKASPPEAGAPPPAAENDPLFAVQPAAAAWSLAALHRVATGRGIVVAVVDSRVEQDHPDLAGQFAASQDFVDDRPGAAETHGTGVAGVIAAKSNNRAGISGVAPEARLMALRACWQTEPKAANAPTLCDSLSLAKALHYAIEHDAAVINLSLSGPPDRLLAQLIGIALSRGITVVAAYDPALPQGGFPASAPNVIRVATQSLAAAPAGVYLAPGEDVPTTQPGGKWGLVDGSSYAAAHVSGLVALVREHSDNLPYPLLAAALPAGGTIDACATMLRAAKPCDCICPKPTISAIAVP